jgi:hypothetical protein
VVTTSECDGVREMRVALLIRVYDASGFDVDAMGAMGDPERGVVPAKGSRPIDSWSLQTALELVKDRIVMCRAAGRSRLGSVR